ncbi:MAG: hypothetical protein ACJ8FO_00090 [Sphingomicrobium sp.]
MLRPLAFICALLLAFVTVSSASVAQSADWVHFTLEPSHKNAANIQASFRDKSHGRDENNWSTGFSPSELVGLDVPSFRRAGSAPIRFAVVREAGRLDCAGTGGGSYAAGDCRFTPNAAFTQLLLSRGIGRPTRDQAFGLMAINAGGEVIDAVAAAHYPTPTIDNLMALSALGVDGRYITDMARAGYHPQSLQKLVEFKALGITPAWIVGFARVGYANLPGEGLVQLRALGVTPDYIQGYQRIGYRNLPVETLVQLKALDITPEFVRSVARPGAPMPPVNQLVELKMFGRHR